MPFRPGQSGNPGGRPKGSARAIAILADEARRHAGIALRTLVMLCRSAKHEQVRLAASIALLDRGFGRPQQTVELTAREAASEGQLSMDALFEGLSHEDRETFTRMLEEASRGREVLDLKASPPAVGELGHAS